MKLNDTQLKQFDEEGWIAHQDFTPIETCDDNALMEYVRRHETFAGLK